MRPTYFPSALFLFVFLCLSLPSHASVLLPEENENQSSGSLLGLTPQENNGSATSATTASPNRPPADQVPSQTTATPAPAPVQSATQAAEPPAPATQTLTISPGGTISQGASSAADKLTANKILNGNLSTATKKSSAFEDSIASMKQAISGLFAREPTIIDERIFLPANDADLISSVGVSADRKYVWGKRDARIVGNALGYLGDDLTKKCQMRFTFKLVTKEEDPRFTAVVLAGGKASIKYNGSPISQVTIKPSAVCFPPASLPKNGGILYRIGDLLAVSLRTEPSCVLTGGRTSIQGVEVTYQGDGQATCRFY